MKSSRGSRHTEQGRQSAGRGGVDGGSEGLRPGQKRELCCRPHSCLKGAWGVGKPRR